MGSIHFFHSLYKTAFSDIYLVINFMKVDLHLHRPSPQSLDKFSA